jgi:hypothetical protein
MDLKGLKNRINILSQQTGQHLPRVEILFCGWRHEGDTDDETHFYYSTAEEKAAVKARLDALPESEDVHRIIIHFVTAEEIAAGEVQS